MFKNFKVLLGALFVIIIFIVSQTSQVSAISVKELLGLDKDDEEQVKAESVEGKKPGSVQKKLATSQDDDWAKPADEATPANPQIDLDYVSLLVANMNQQERLKILDDADLFKQVIENEANNRSAVSAARANKLDQDRNVKFLMSRGAGNILRETYLNRLIINKLPKDFPSVEQVTEYYEANKDKFVVPERIHVWQIFFKNLEMMIKRKRCVKEKANKIIADIKKGKADYSNVAITQSEHEQSKSVGGYMGLLKTSELLPEMKESILTLKEGELSKPVESESGIHILKRGKILVSETLELAQVESQIRQLLVNQANLQLRNAIFSQARKEYPQEISDKKLEEWRLRLKTSTH